MSSGDQQKFGQWTILQDLGNDRVLCQCSCGTVKINSKYHVTHGRSKSCGCLALELKKQLKTNTEGMKFNDWTVIKELGKGKVLCRCKCGTEKICTKNSITSGKSKSCGHSTNKKKNIEGQKINEWTILHELGYGYVECQCSCGTITTMKKAVILGGYSKSCGCKKTELMQNTLLQRYGELTANKTAKPREKWQIETLNNKDKFINYIQSLKDKPTIRELTSLLGVNEATIGRTIKAFGAEQYVNIRPLTSEPEIELRNFIQNIYNQGIQSNVRGIIGRQELDIYLPDLKLAIEYNGDYWHSDINRSPLYHQNKTVECSKQGIRLVHIFEYEWKNDIQKEKIKSHLRSLINNTGKNIVYAKETEVKLISAKEAYRFEDKYHLQGRATSSINIGLIYQDKLVGIMAFGIPRFTDEAEYELIRLCYDTTYSVVGGSEKLFKYFITNYNPNSIVSYCDISKFNGAVYTKLGFESKVSYLTKPNYKWVNTYDSTVLPRYQTQKQLLVDKGLGSEEQTEREIMEELGYIRIYDSGNLKFIWKNQ